MDKLDFLSVVRQFQTYRAARAVVKESHDYETPEIQELAMVFDNNIVRLETLARLPERLLGTAIGLEQAYRDASIKIWGRNRPELIPRTAEMEEQLDAEYRAAVLNAMLPPDDLRVNYLITSLSDSVEITRSGFRTIFDNILISSWTGVESLMTDLWVKAVNLRPQSLGLVAMKAQKRRKDSEDDAGESASKGKPQAISVDMLAKYKFDLKNRIGYFCWRERKFDFNSLDGLRYAYKTVFEEDWFENKFVDDLSILEAMRHVLVHRGGLVDESFQERVKNHAEFSKLELGKPLEVDGETVGRYFRAAALHASLLLKKADEWLQTNPT